jgi:hypothetical protein
MEEENITTINDCHPQFKKHSMREYSLVEDVKQKIQLTFLNVNIKT